MFLYFIFPLNISAVDAVLSKRPIAMLDTQVDIQPYLPLLSSDDPLTSLDIQGLPIKLTEDLLASQLNSILNPSTLLGENHQGLIFLILFFRSP